MNYNVPPSVDTGTTNTNKPEKPESPLKQTEKKEPQEDVKAIANSLDGLDELLDPKNFDKNFAAAGQSLPMENELNQKITRITAHLNVMDQVSREEYSLLQTKARNVLSKLWETYDKCQAEKLRGKDIKDPTLKWLGEEGPLVMDKIQKLLNKVG